MKEKVTTNDGEVEEIEVKKEDVFEVERMMLFYS